MRIATWNIHGAKDAPLDRLAREIVALGADVVCLNEVPRRLGRRLGTRTGMRAYVASSFIGPYGNAVLTNLTGRWRRMRFDGTCRVDRRDAVLLELDAGVTIAGIHLNSLRPKQRIRDARQLVAVLPERAIVAGDLNETATGVVAGEFARRFDDAGAREDAPTFPADMPRVRIDFIWVPRGTHVTGCRTPATDASDHRPVVVDIEA